MAETKRITCTLGVYTLLAQAKDSVSFRVPTTKGGRLAIAASLPAPDTADYKSFSRPENVSLGSLGSSNVYWMPNDSEQIVEVIRG